jgi:hypothetical protein
MRPPMRFFKFYGRAYLTYVALKWGVLGSVFIVLSQVEGFTWAWLLWWPVIGIPTAVTFSVHRIHNLKHHSQSDDNNPFAQ